MKAIIDIGSNSVRLMLDEKQGVNKKYLNSTTLAEKLAITGRLIPEAIERTADAVVDFYDAAKNMGADEIFVFGTEAMRAKGGEQLKEIIESRVPVVVDIVSGETEALLGFAGCSEGRNCAVIDVGGASVEVVSGQKNKITYAKSLKLGVVRTRDITGDDRQLIEDFYRISVSGYDKVKAKQLIAIGGTATSIASMILRQTTYDQTKTHGCFVSLENLRALEDEVFSGIDIQKTFPTLSYKRSLVIKHGIIVFKVLTEYLGFDGFTVSELDNMEGYIKLKCK